ncbi:MipA/OmpV family protein [Granulosicoccus antarcticus]|uniref:Uncharacterized protein n=1 Tax=Granulosicoccus antarcticus IMCC3135 TaxID=1192854 RepID=A0A2Z2NM64_9GAMM|nr:MipA/OmpV family protein [Granulosicoccus antarcticus]ASJ70868.1 hypothetical protein IMCC3135_03775 [Granulosicoccus antarcticus IMCC3135]
MQPRAHISTYCRILTTLTLSLLALAGNAAAHEIGVGVYMKPEYQGADKYQPVVLPSAKTLLGPVGLTLRGVELQMDLVPSPKLNTGFVVRYDEGRSADISDKNVRLMEPIDDALEVGLFLQSGIPVNMLGIDDPALIIASLDITDTFGAGHDGTLLSISIGLLREFSSKTTAIGQLQLAYADSEYNSAYFGVNESDSNLSSLAEFEADKGLKDIGLALTIIQEFDGPWSGGLTVSVKHFSDELADSPVISLRGAEEQWTGGLFTNYQF